MRATQRSRLTPVILAGAVLLRRVSQWADRVRREVSRTLTAAGWVTVTLATAGFLVGWLFGWSEWIVAGLIGVALLILALPFLFGSRAYDVSLDVADNRVVAGSTISAHVVVRNRTPRAVLPGRVDLPLGDGIVEIPVPLLRAGKSLPHPVTVPAVQRGIIRVGPATVVRSDPLGLVHRENEWADVHDIYVHPRTVSVPSTTAGLIRDLEGNPTSRLVDADLAFHAIREYAPGDAQRQVHWKSTAKTGKLMVRQFEESRRSRLAIALSVATRDYTDEAEYELAVSAAASLGVQARRDGRDVDIAVGAAVPRVVRGRMRAVRDLAAVTPRTLLDEFCSVDSLEDTVRLEDVCSLQAEGSPGISVAFIVCGANVDLRRLRRAVLAYPQDTAVIAVICDATAHPRIRPINGLTIMTIGVLDDLPALISRGLRA